MLLSVRNVVGLMSHSTYKRSFQRWVCRGDQLHWQW